jgi:hypothetical protein
MKRFLALSVALFMVTCLIPSGSGATPVDMSTLKGNVIGTDGGPLADVLVRAMNVTTGDTYSGVSNDTGGYGIDLPDGTYNITASLINHTANRTYGPLILPNMSAGRYNFTMVEILGVVTGFITDGQLPVYGVKVTISNAHFNYTALSVQPLGTFEVTGVKPGTYVAYAEKRGYNRASYDTPLNMDRGSTIEVNFTMEKQPALVEGKIYGEASRTLEGVKVTLTPVDGSADRVVLSDQNGNYTITDVPVGDYRIAFEKTDYREQHEDISFGPYENKRVDITLVKVPKNSTALLFGYDLIHSLMIVGFGVGMVVVILGVFISIRVQKRPELLARIDADEEKKDEP